MKQILIYGFFMLPFFAIGQKRYSPEIEVILNKTAANRPELEKTIDYFLKEGDPLKIKALYFLLSNMDIHYSEDYYWSDSAGNKISFNELQYPDFETSLKAFDNIKQHNSKIHPVTVRYKDIDSVKSGMLIENINLAFQVWQKPWAKNLTFENFCEYVLPYRIAVEPLQNWRNKYLSKFSWINDSTDGRNTREALQYLIADYNKWFVNTYGIESRDEPLPRLGALQLLHRKKGPCEDIADLEVFTLRSQGFPASIDEIPFWATASGKHFLNVTFDNKMAPIPFDVSTPSVTINKLAREPSKVIRRTYSRQNNVLASKESVDNIPDGFMRTVNYIDVTKEYWETKDVSCSLFSAPASSKIAYACVFNFLEWHPTWWSSVKDNKAVFSDMCKGAVYLPMYYVNGKLKPAGYPIASGYNNTLELKPNTANYRTIHINEQAGYLVFRPGKNYTLFYWNNSWKKLGQKKAEQTSKELVFDRVPKNALLLLLPEYSQHKERPFIITDDNQRIWW